VQPEKINSDGKQLNHRNELRRNVKPILTEAD